MRREIGNGHSKFFFFFWLGCGLGPNLAGLNGAHGAPRAPVEAGPGPGKKNPISKRAGFGLRVKTRGSGPGMKKPGPNPTRCHP